MPPIGLRDLFLIFLKAGTAFGGGLGILTVLEEELVTKRRALTQEEFLSTYAIGRIVPAGTMTALAAAFGQRFGGFSGTVVALVAMVLPSFTVTVALAAAYVSLAGTAVFDLLPVTILPAALAFIATGAIRMSKGVFRPSFDAVLAVAAFLGLFVLELNPATLLLGGGVLGAVALTVHGRWQGATA